MLKIRITNKSTGRVVTVGSARELLDEFPFIKQHFCCDVTDLLVEIEDNYVLVGDACGACYPLSTLLMESPGHDKKHFVIEILLSDDMVLAKYELK